MIMEPSKVIVPTMLWKTQLLDLVSEAPKAQCVECKGITPHHRLFFTSYPHHHNPPSTLSGDHDHDFSSEVSDSLSNELHSNTNVINEQSCDSLTEELIQVNLRIANSLSNDLHTDNPSVKNKSKSEEKLTPNKSCKTAAAPWARPSVYYFNPFASAFHGNLNYPSIKKLLTADGQFLVRKRSEDEDEQFVLSVRFNGRIKNFLIHFDDNTGLIYNLGKEKGFDSLEDLVQDGLVTMHLTHKAGPYIDLLYDLTKANDNGAKYKNLAGKGKESKDNIPMDNIYEYFDSSNGSPIKGRKFGNSSKQNSPSPVSSLSGSSLERMRPPDLRSHSFKTHTFHELSKCHICHNFLWGLASQGLLCEHCDLIIHEACISKVSQDCEPSIAKYPSIFRISLTIMVKASPGGKAPFLLQKCISEIDKRGLAVEGIYRISGTRDGTEKLKTMLERDRELADLSGHNDIHSMCSIVKLFLRELPDPLISEQVFQTFLNSSQTSSPNVDSVRRELKKLPPANYITLKFLLQHLHRVAENSESNKMNPFNLSSVFAPTVFSDRQISISTLPTGTHLLEIMITQVRNLFPK